VATARTQAVFWQGQRYIIEEGNLSLANYSDIFRTDLLGSTHVFVLEREVKMIKIIEGKNRQNNFNYTETSGDKLDLP